MNEEPKLELLPQSIQELDAFVASLCSEFNLPETDDTYELVATTIMHMNANCARAPKEFFAEGVRKSLANAAAYTKLSEFRDKRNAVRAEAEAKAKEASREEVLPN